MMRLSLPAALAVASLQAQVCQQVVVAGRPFDVKFPAPAVRFSLSDSQLALTVSGTLLFSQQGQLFALDGALVNPWAPPFPGNNLFLRALTPAPDGSVLATDNNRVVRLHQDGTLET